VAISVNLPSYREMRREPERVFHERVLAHPFLAPRVTDLAWDGRLMGCGPRDAVIRVPSGPGWALVGDASMHQDPWTGLGMDNAAVHARLLGEAIDDALSSRATEASALARYYEARDEHALASFHETAEIGRDLNVFRQT
jgi:flavin-dependent dehydrogenase